MADGLAVWQMMCRPGAFGPKSREGAHLMAQYYSIGRDLGLWDAARAKSQHPAPNGPLSNRFLTLARRWKVRTKSL